MLARLTATAPGGVTTVLADLTTWRPPAPAYRLAILGLNSLFLMAERQQQRAALESLAAALVPGGLAVVDIWLPDAADLARYDQRLLLDYVRTDPQTGRTVTKTVAALHDAATATVLLSAIYEEGLPGEPAVRWIRRDVLRLISAGGARRPGPGGRPGGGRAGRRLRPRPARAGQRAGDPRGQASIASMAVRAMARSVG